MRFRVGLMTLALLLASGAAQAQDKTETEWMPKQTNMQAVDLNVNRAWQQSRPNRFKSGSQPAVIIVGSLATLSQCAYDGGLLRIDGVQEELNIKPDQLHRILTFERVNERATMERLGGFERVQGDSAAWKQINAARCQDEHLLVSSTLTLAGQARYKQIWLQWNGLRAFLFDEVASDLKLTPEQRAKIAALDREQNEMQRRKFAEWEARGRKPMDISRPEAHQQFLNEWRPYRRSVLAVLTSAQQSQWRTMIGPVFKWLAHSRGYDAY